MTIKLQIDKGPCHKCKQEIDPGNNALYWTVAYDAFLKGVDPVLALRQFADKSMHVFVYTPRHLVPVLGCEGSPSRASMALEGMVSYDSQTDARLPRDKWTPLSEKKAADARKAYELIKTIVG